jgi:Right handed beta helix region
VRRRLSRLLLRLTITGLVLTGSVTAFSAVASAVTAAASTFHVYLAPSAKGGSDRHTGLTTSSPVLTLARAQQVLEQHRPAGNVVVLIEQGTYVAGQTTWQFYVPGHMITFMPINYTVGHHRPPGGDPVFADPKTRNGTHVGQTWFTAVLPPAPSPLHHGGSTRLRFYYLAIEDYTQAISFNGLGGHSGHNKTFYIQENAGLNGNDVSGMTFYDIGDLYAPVPPPGAGYGVILFTNSSHDTIYNNTFDHIRNSGDHDELHGLYITHFSSNNTADKNLFEDTNGEPVKVRDRSNYNNVFSNRFDSTGGVAAYLDDFCDATCVRTADTKKYRECASYGNRFEFNTIEPGPIVDLIPPGEHYAGGPGCSIPAGQERVYLHGNG